MRKIFLAVLILINILDANSQDTHYSNQQFGTKSCLMGGAVIGGVRDNSAVFYNPGALGFIENKELSISANAYQLDRIIMNDGAGKNIKLKSSTMQTMPLIISGLMKHKKYPKHTFGYCLLTADQFNIKTSGRISQLRNLIPDSLSAGEEDYVGQFQLRASVYEFVSGWGYGYKVNDKLSIGIGNYGFYRSYHVDRYRVSRVVSTDTNATRKVASFNRNNSMELKNVRTVLKAGAALQLKKWRFGVTVTSPSINVWGLANFVSDITSVNVDYNGDGNYDSFVANDSEEGLKTLYKTPLTIAGGIEFNNDDKTIISLAINWYDKVDEYTVLKPRSNTFYRPSGYNLPTSDNVLTIKESKKSIMNFAIGFEQKLNDKYSMNLSVRTNHTHSTQEKLNDLNISFTNWNIYHLSIGGTKRREKSDLSVCAVFSYGFKNNFYQYVNLQNAAQENRFIGNLEQTKVLYSAVAVIIGYTFRSK